MSKLVDDTIKDGFEVFVMACDREDLNDNDVKLSYVRASSNLRHHNPLISLVGVLNSPLNDLVSRLNANEQYCMIHQFPSYKLINKISGNEKVQLELESRGIYPALGTSIMINEPLVKNFSEIRDVLTGRLEPVKLSEILRTTSDEPAYYTSFHINSPLRDSKSGSSRPVNYGPTLYVFGTKELTQGIVNHLRKKPNDYEKMIQLILPGIKYPNINKGVLDEQVSTNKLAIITFDKFKEYLQVLNPDIKSDSYKTVNKGLFFRKEVQMLIKGDVLNDIELSINGQFSLEELLLNITDVYNKN